MTEHAWPPKGVDPDSIKDGGLLVTVPSEELRKMLDLPIPNTVDVFRMKAMALVELLYRAGIRSREAYECAWVAIMAGTPLESPPPWLCAPSEMSPEYRRAPHPWTIKSVN